ncbi:pimeloyl-ACP methyl ester esterase BioH [Candidatus Ishikawella capsulata]|uniref:Pimeloyl-[acyl-carrier protein] methyl ester esterase n=1 Tax=Candidatus Ishikawaella capsulata Mpkobe TaxID=476281 RepID=C5WCC0_9ENTR|nr:pimeloyl-ACP methyl ester esterase BioH [Candidatus Ishikawaella capsulata]BAH82976.1 carboxylesterase of pimeloyl-CoA synthesis [Candidatus Ishikawaella capsulata Mpkobe]
MKPFYYHTCGHGTINLVLLHGWGLNAKIWDTILSWLNPYFRVYLIDLPGFGYNQRYEATLLREMSQFLVPIIPEDSFVLGWSLGGLVASYLAITQPHKIKGLITVASSPCFIKKVHWPGIKMQTLIEIKKQLNKNFYRTLERFFILQTIGSQTAIKDIHTFNKVILSCSIPRLSALENSLNILCNTDLRNALLQVSCPFLRIYGALDGLVPRSISRLLDEMYPNSKSIIMQKAAHAPFLSHPTLFCQHIINFIKA